MTPDASRRTRALLAGLAAILVWQLVFFRHADPDPTLQNGYRLEASNGVAEWQPEFVYFLYHLNLYPIVSLSESRRVNSAEGARRLISEEGASLAMDRYWTVRYGDLAKTYLYLPGAWARNTAARPRMLHANAIGFTLALTALFASLWYVRRTGLAVLLVLLLGSNPFQVHEVYANNNLFGWPITLTLLLLALHVPLLRDEERVGRLVLALAAVSGLLLGTMRHVRSEPALAIFGVAFAYLTATRLRLPARLAAVVLLGGGFVATSAGWTAYFDAKFREAQRVVRDAGGHVYNGPRHTYHFFWHALWCGLGDFDQKYGHKWSDITAFSYAGAIQQQMKRADPPGYPPLAADATDVFSLGVYWDEGRKYPRTPYETEEYLEIIRGKLLRDIVHDPGWYLAILARRLARLLAEGTPPSLALGNGAWFALPGGGLWGWLGLGAVALLLRGRNWFGLKLVAFTLPLAGTALLVYSGGGTTRYSIAHLVALALGAGVLLEPLKHGRALSWRPRLNLRLPSPATRARLAAAATAVVALALVGWILARRLVPATNAVAAGSDAPHVVVLRFENATSDEALAWYGDAVADAAADTLRQAGLRILDPDAAENLDANLLWWGPYGVPSAPPALAANVAADRSGAERVLLGRIRRGPGGAVACATLFSASTRRAGPERCEAFSEAGILEAGRRIATAALPAGSSASQAPVRELAAPEVESLMQRTEARRAIRRQLWGEAERLLSLEGGPGSSLDTTLARMQTRWQPLEPRLLYATTGRADTAGALGVLRARVAADPEATERRVELARTLAALELFAEAQDVLGPLRFRPGTSPEAYGILAETLSARGELDRGYLALREYLRRSWREPRAESLLAQHLVRWNDLDGAALHLGNSAKDRVERAAADTTLDDLATAWRIAILRDAWPRAEQIAHQMSGIDDPRAGGVAALHVAQTLLLRGRSQLAQAFAEEAAFRLSRERLDPAAALRLAAEIALERGDARHALELTHPEWRGAPGAPDLAATLVQPSDPESLVLRAIASARAGRWSDARVSRTQLADSIASRPGPVARRALHRLDGELALIGKDPSAAVTAFSSAERLLPPRGFCGDHVPVWYGLGRAYRAARDVARAESWLNRVAEASYERLCWPIPYARSFDELGRIRAGSDRRPEAGASFARFLELWRSADFADAETRAARSFLAGDAATERAAAPAPRD